MLRFVNAKELDNFGHLKTTMFKDRARQFKDRLGWDVTVNQFGEERDQYDELDPLYVIWVRKDGSHGGSARFLPTTGRTMVNEHFLHLTDGVALRSPFIWECTRFCLASGSSPAVASTIMLGGAKLMQAFAVEHFVGVFHYPMLRVYKRIGASPDLLGASGPSRTDIGVGLWHFSEGSQRSLLARSGVTLGEIDWWFASSFDAAEPIGLSEVA
jgi:acyl homoserine lactone synthase